MMCVNFCVDCKYHKFEEGADMVDIDRCECFANHVCMYSAVHGYRNPVTKELMYPYGCDCELARGNKLFCAVYEPKNDDAKQKEEQ